MNYPSGKIQLLMSEKPGIGIGHCPKCSEFWFERNMSEITTQRVAMMRIQNNYKGYQQDEEDHH